MKKEFIPYEQALALKELGFDEPCLAQWDEMKLYPLQQGGESDYFEINKNSRLSFNTMAPLYQQAFRWFREKYDLDSYVIPARLETKKVYDYYIWFTNEKEERDLFIGMNNQYAYEEAELECLNKLIEIVKIKQDESR